MGLHNYILVDKQPVHEPDLLKWATWFEAANRIVAQTEIVPGVLVSTVFLGIDHQWFDGPSLFFETMVFNDYGAADFQERYSTWAEAEVGHLEVVERLQEEHQVFADGGAARCS